MAKKAPGYAIDIYQECEEWDGSRADAQATFDSIQDSLEDRYPTIVEDAAAEAEEVDLPGDDEEE
jgi:hypothetical protein